MVHNVQKSPNGKALEEIKKFDEDGIVKEIQERIENEDDTVEKFMSLKKILRLSFLRKLNQPAMQVSGNF